MKLYLDTNVYLDYFLNRKNSYHAFRIFQRTLKCKYQIILSDHLLSELDKNMILSDTKVLFEILKHKIIRVYTDMSDAISAEKLPTHYADALHIILAKKAGAECIVTNNTRDFNLIFKADCPEHF